MPYESGHDANGLAAIARAMREAASPVVVAPVADSKKAKKSTTQQVGPRD
jgi:hypothetical protein